MTPARKAPSELPGARAQAARHEPRRAAWAAEAKQISDRTGVMGSRSTSIRPVTSGNWTHRDPIEERGVPCGENRCRATRERTLGLTNLSTKRQRIAELARTKRGVAFHLRNFLDRRVRDGVNDNIRERNSFMKNRKREYCTSGSVRDEGGNILIYSAAAKRPSARSSELHQQLAEVLALEQAEERCR